MDFASASPAVVRSIRQRDLLNGWLRLYARQQQAPQLTEYNPERLDDELQDLVYYTIDNTPQPPRLTIDSNGTRMSLAFGNTGKGRFLDEYLGPILGPVILPAYYACIDRVLPTYTVSMIDDVNGRAVAYERLLMPFSDGHTVNHIVASLKTISEDGGFEIRNLLRGHQSVPTPKVRAVIDHDLFHRIPGPIDAGDVIEFG
ncbi:hypothetical protein BH11PSE4_BH11PSE4_07110 [soil metagenome]